MPVIENQPLTILPTLRIVQSLPLFMQYTFEDADGPIDLTTWTGEFLIARRPFDEALLRTDLTLNASGEIRLNLTGEQTAELPTLPRIGGSTNAVFQIRLTALDPEFNQLWQGDAIIAGQFQ